MVFLSINRLFVNTVNTTNHQPITTILQILCPVFPPPSPFMLFWRRGGEGLWSSLRWIYDWEGYIKSFDSLKRRVFSAERGFTAAVRGTMARFWGFLSRSAPMLLRHNVRRFRQETNAAFFLPVFVSDSTMTKHLSHFNAIIMGLWFRECNHFSRKQLESRRISCMRG